MHFLSAIALALLALSAHADTKQQLMFSHYLRYQLCMQRQLGQGFYERHHLDHVINRWGATEMTQAAAMNAPSAVKRADDQCRVANEISDQPRPTGTGLVVDPAHRVRQL